jgi:hypothetical protein
MKKLVLAAVVMKSSVFWDITQFSTLKFKRRFGGTRRLHLQDRRISQASNLSALVEGEWPASLPCRFTLVKEPPVPIGQEAGWVPEPVSTTWRRENASPYRDSNSDPSIVQPVAGRYTDYAISAPQTYSCSKLIKHHDMMGYEGSNICLRSFLSFGTGYR